MVLGKLVNRMKLEHFLIPYTKINSKWIKDLNVRPKTIKLLEKNIGKTLSDINHKILYDPPPRILRQSSGWEKIIASEEMYTGLISKIYKQLLQLNSRKINDPIKKWAKV